MKNKTNGGNKSGVVGRVAINYGEVTLWDVILYSGCQPDSDKNIGTNIGI